MNTFFDLFERYKLHLEDRNDAQSIPHIQTALLRFTIPEWEGPIIQGSKATASEVTAGLTFMQTLEVTKIEEAIDAQSRVFAKLKVSKQRQRQIRHYLKRMVDWAVAEKIASPESNTESQKENYVFRTRREPVKNLTTRCGSFSPYALGKIPGDYINEKLQVELDNFTEFIGAELNCKSKITREDKIKPSLMKILGWAVRQGKQSLSNLSLTFLVPCVDLHPRIENYPSYEKYCIAKVEADRKARDSAEYTVKLCKEYFASREKVINTWSFRSKDGYVDNLIRVAKYIYRDQTDKGIAKNFEDIPAVVRLQNYCKEIRDSNTDPDFLVVPHDKKFVSWVEVISTLEKLRTEANLEENWYLDGHKRVMCRHQRVPQSIAKSYQQFLLLGFFVLIPPDRQRTVRELMYGRNLKYGFFQDQRFIAKDINEDCPGAALFLFHKADDYKTGSTYGNWYAPIPNTDFPDGKNFYYYIRRWLNEYRETLKPNHDYFFTQSRKHKPLNGHDTYQIIRAIFARFTGVLVNPHELRHIYNTHLADIEATDAQRRSTALCMKQSEATARKVYTHQQIQSKLNPGLSLMMQINEEILNSLAPTESSTTL